MQLRDFISACHIEVKSARTFYNKGKKGDSVQTLHRLGKFILAEFPGKTELANLPDPELKGKE